MTTGLGEEGTASALITFPLLLLIFPEEDAVEVMENRESRIMLNYIFLPKSAVISQPKAAIPVLFAYKH